MKHRAVGIVLLLTLGIAPRAARAETYFGFQMGIADAPPPPMFTFRHEPRIVVVPQTRVSRLEDPCDADVFRFGGTWYVYAEGYWYRGVDLHGAFRVLDARDVPRAVLFVPPVHWKHHPHDGPPGLMARQASSIMVRQDRHQVWRHRREEKREARDQRHEHHERHEQRDHGHSH